MAAMRENQTITSRRRRRPPPLQEIREPDEIDNLDEIMLQFPTISSNPIRFLPISSPSAEEHGYQINVSKDGSMITAVPIVEPNKRRNGIQRLHSMQRFAMTHPHLRSW